MKSLFLLLLIPLVSLAEVCTTTNAINTSNYATKNGDRELTFIAIDLKNKNCHVINEKGLNNRHSPWSTFKIPHTLIALETGVVKTINESVEWDPKVYPAKPFWPEAWKKSQTLKTAFQRSAVWYYQALVPRIKPDQYKQWLAKFHYGNQTFTEGSNQFWLNDELTISPLEQIDFIVCLLTDRCGISVDTFAAFESVALQETKNGSSLYAKTGAGPLDLNNNDGAFEGWYVGYIKDKNGIATTAFVTYMQADSFSRLLNYRKELSLKLLNDLDLWPK